MAEARQGYNADAKLQERQKREFVIGGRVGIPRKKTRAMMRDLALATPTQDGRDENDPQAAADSIDTLYTQVQALLIDKDTGEQFEQDFIDEELDMEDAAEIVESLMPEQEQGPTGQPAATGG